MRLSTLRKEFHYWNKTLTLKGHVVFSLAVFPSQEGKKHWYTDAEKQMLDTTYLLKISLSEAVLALNVDGYVGKGLRRELAWARSNDKRIYSLVEMDDASPSKELLS